MGIEVSNFRRFKNEWVSNTMWDEVWRNPLPWHEVHTTYYMALLYLFVIGTTEEVGEPMKKCGRRIVLDKWRCVPLVAETRTTAVQVLCSPSRAAPGASQCPAGKECELQCHGRLGRFSSLSRSSSAESRQRCVISASLRASHSKEMSSWSCQQERRVSLESASPSTAESPPRTLSSLGSTPVAKAESM